MVATLDHHESGADTDLLRHRNWPHGLFGPISAMVRLTGMLFLVLCAIMAFKHVRHASLFAVVW